MTERMKELLEDPQNPETIHRVWPIIKEILTEQQLILVAADADDGSKKLQGFATAYRCLEKFQLEGKKRLSKTSVNSHN